MTSHAHAQTSDETLSSTVVLDQDVALQPFERAVFCAKVVTSDLEAFAFRKVMIDFATPNRVLKNTIFVEDTIASVGETGVFYVSVGTLTSNAQKVKCGTMLGTASEGLSVREVRKRTDPDLLAPIPGPESQVEEVQTL